MRQEKSIGLGEFALHHALREKWRVQVLISEP